MLTIKDVTKHYPGTGKGISHLSLHVEKGDIFAFIGPNGAGKTTTLKAISGIHDFDAGEILVDGLSLRENSLACRQVMAYIPDNPDLYGFLTGMQYLSFAAGVYGMSRQMLEEQTEILCGEFGILQDLNSLIGTYSHGMKQKLALVSAFMHSPRLLLLDEPFVGLDPQAVFMVKERMRQLCRQGGAVFFSTHVLEVAEKLCNKAAIVKDGTLVASGTMEELLGGGQSLEALFMEVAAHESD